MKSYTYSALGSHGRLGNQMWQIAWVIGSAVKSNGKACIQKNWDYKKFFSIPEEYFVSPSGEIVDGGDFFYQELHHWDSCANLIYDIFQPSELSLEHLRNNYPDWFFDSNVNKTALHVRAGDYLQHPTRFPVPTDKYYSTAIQSLGATRLVVFSDDINYAKRKLSTMEIDDVVFIDGIARPVRPARRLGEPQDQWDLFLMTLCQQHIIANSTFSWWGAYLGNSEAVYYPSIWWGPDLDAKDSRGLDIRKSWVDAIPNEWRKVEC